MEYAAHLRERFGMATRERQKELHGLISPHKSHRTCDACRHWGTNPASEWHSAAYRDDQPGESKFCGSTSITDGVSDSGDPAIASAVDCEGYHAFLLTGPRFGCVHWEAKAPTPPLQTPS